MFAQTITIDSRGRIVLPEQILNAIGVQPKHETEVIVELTDAGILIKPKLQPTPITDRIAAMNLPIADWDEMEKEIEAGRQT
jgi:bifunctional DNA-binding transcriptional regulator/antitoxin component of YhaV-PrlF toxin-antitoxin module